MGRLKSLWLLLILGCNVVGDGGNPLPPTAVSSVLVQVDQIVDGDSFRTSSGEVRLIGVNAPERDECYGRESREWLAGVLERNEVEIGPSATDQFDRLLAEVTIDGLSVNQEAVASGHAFALSDFADLIVVEDRARDEGVGLWGDDICGATGPKSTLTIDEVDYNPPGEDSAELVVIGNPSTAPVNLNGFVLRDESSINRFSFPEIVLEPDATVVVTTACASEVALGWCTDQPVWNNGGDAVILLDHFGRVVAFRRY